MLRKTYEKQHVISFEYVYGTMFEQLGIFVWDCQVRAKKWSKVMKNVHFAWKHFSRHIPLFLCYVKFASDSILNGMAMYCLTPLQTTELDSIKQQRVPNKSQLLEGKVHKHLRMWTECALHLKQVGAHWHVTCCSLKHTRLACSTFTERCKSKLSPLQITDGTEIKTAWFLKHGKILERKYLHF